MAHLLQIDRSARTTGSISRQLLVQFAGHWMAANPAGTITYRDLAANPVPHLSEATLAAMFIPPTVRNAEQVVAAALQEGLIAELAAADTVVIGAPMHNFGFCRTPGYNYRARVMAHGARRGYPPGREARQ